MPNPQASSGQRSNAEHYIYRTYEGSEHLLQAVLAPATGIADHDRTSLTPGVKTAGSSFNRGTATLDEAVTLARRGWKEGIKALDGMRMSVEHQLEGTVPIPETRHRLYGNVINMGRHMQGKPDVFMHRVDSAIMRETGKPRVIRLVFNATVSGSISADTILRRGAAACVLAETLELHRMRVQIELAFATSNRIEGGDVIEHRLVVKQFGEPLALDKLSFFLSHPASLRRLFFALLEHEDKADRARFGIGRDFGASMGFPGEVEDQGDIYLPRIVSNTDWSPALTTMWLTETLKEQGLKLTKDPVVASV